MQTQSIDTPGEGISAEEFRSRIEHVSAAIAKAGLAGLAAFCDCSGCSPRITAPGR